ncbi:hypothetical protein GALMADRAFT_230324 [Galerina marginata CBS 339.88]|uniref:Uncharacterized protein n=1 Tax=Galerina marginata (strain CBS 339.88) TaxID=685588 RepID=A0A067SGH8_GALM3|nr:hypothetical protein GALMADRAFT_230324 [Galerina marginata CBS 339.88]
MKLTQRAQECAQRLAAVPCYHQGRELECRSKIEWAWNPVDAQLAIVRRVGKRQDDLDVGVLFILYLCSLLA